MIGFYFKYSKNDSLQKFEISILTFEDFTCINKPRQNCLYLFKDNSTSSLLQTDHATYYSIGTFILDNKYGKDALHHLNDRISNEESIENIAKESHGQFCLICYLNDKVVIFNDKMASFPIYQSLNNNEVIITNILTLIIKHQRVSFNNQSLTEYLSFSYVLNGTLFNEISMLSMATYLQFQGHSRTSIKYYDLFNNITYNNIHSLEEASEITINKVINNLSFLQNTYPFVDLTGGFDGRFICTILKHIGVQFAAGITGEQIEGEQRIARQAANLLGVEFYENFKINDKNTFDDFLNIHLSVASGVPIPYHSTELFYYYSEIKKLAPIHVTGFGGSQVMFKWWKKLDLFPSINVSKYVDRQFRFSDIFKKDFINENDFRSFAIRKLNNILDDIGTQEYTKVANYLGLFTFTKSYHACLINNHNCILPFYSPFLEADLFKTLLSIPLKYKKNHRLQRKIISKLNRELSLLQTSHGYTANIDTYSVKLLQNSINDYLRVIKFKIHSPFKNNPFYKKIDNLTIRKPMADFDRKYWINSLNSKVESFDGIYRIIDKNKIPENNNKLLAKIAYIEYLMNNYDIPIR